MATKRRKSTPSRRPVKRTSTPRRSAGGGGGSVAGRASASATANLGNGWLSGWFNNFALIRFGGSGGGGGGLKSLARAISSGRSGGGPLAEAAADSCPRCGGSDYHSPDCRENEQADYTIDAEVIESRPALGPGGVE